VKLHSVESVLAAMMALIMMSTTMAFAAVPVIGTVTAKGSFRLDNATVSGNATLFEGATVETKTAGSRMELSTGARVSLGTESKAKFFLDRMILERGEGQMEKASTFRFEARGLTFQPETGTASARFSLGSGARVELAVLSGSFRVLNSKGVLVANALPGHSLELEPQAPDAVSKLTGTLRQAGGHYLLTDETTNVTVELAGPGLSKEVGNRVEISGSMDPTATPVTDASQFIRVSAVKRLGKAGTAAAAKGGAAGGTAGGAAGGAAGGGIAGVSVATIAIIGGVAAAATLGGLAAAGKLPGQGSSTISR
jgi:hypothetical protein